MLASKLVRQAFLTYSRHLLSPHRPFCTATEPRLEKLDEPYNNQMIDKLVKMHETLTFQNKPETSTPAANPKREAPKLGSIFSRTLLKIKNWKIEGYSPELKELNLAMLSMMYNKNLKHMYQNFAYDKKFVYPKIIVEFKDFILATQKPPPIKEAEYNKNLVKLSTCFECMSLGYFLHEQLGATDLLKKKLNASMYGIASGWVEKYLSDGKLLLAGDFFHTKASKISSEFGRVEIPHFLAVIEESLAKAVIKREDLHNKKDFSDLRNQMYISYHETCVMLSLALKATHILMYDGITESQQDTLTNFSLNFGLAWYLVSTYKKEKAEEQELKYKKASLVDSFLEKEMARLQETDKVSTLRTVVNTHLLEAQKALLSYTMEEEQVRYFVEDKLVEVTGIDAMKDF